MSMPGRESSSQETQRGFSYWQEVVTRVCCDSGWSSIIPCHSGRWSYSTPTYRFRSASTQLDGNNSPEEDIDYPVVQALDPPIAPPVRNLPVDYNLLAYLLWFVDLHVKWNLRPTCFILGWRRNVISFLFVTSYVSQHIVLGPAPLLCSHNDLCGNNKQFFYSQTILLAILPSQHRTFVFVSRKYGSTTK